MSPEGYRKSSPEFPQHFFQFIDSLGVIKWIKPPDRRPDCLSDNVNFTYLFGSYEWAKSVSGNNYGDRWQEIDTEISIVMKSQLDEKEFVHRKLEIKNQALHLSENCNLKDSFFDDAVLYYFYKNYNKHSPNFSYVENRWNIWCHGYGVTGERTNLSISKTIFYCYKRLP
jgi:hypothetical protein